MRNKTLLIRRHLIHYWHLSNQTTFHKTLFSHSDDEDWKIEHGKYAPCLGKLSQSTEIFPCLRHRPKHLPARADFNNVVTGSGRLEVASENCCEIVPKTRRIPRERREVSVACAGHGRIFAERENCRQTHPFTTNVYCVLLPVDATALHSLISTHWFLMKVIHDGTWRASFRISPNVICEATSQLAGTHWPCRIISLLKWLEIWINQTRHCLNVHKAFCAVISLMAIFAAFQLEKYSMHNVYLIKLFPFSPDN